jgi:putative drug exporter of the RND superfamily
MSLVRLAQWSFRRRRAVLGAWIVALVGVIGLSVSVGAEAVDNFELPGSDSQDAYDLLGERFPANAGDSARIVVRTDPSVAGIEAGIDADAARSAFDAVLAEVATFDHVVGVDSPYTAGNEIQRSPDGVTAYATVHFDRRAAEVPVDVAKDVVALVDDADAPGLRFEAGGSPLEEAEQEPPGTAELIGLLAAVVILVVAFGSLLAMALPILTALFGIAIGIGLIGLLGHLLDMPSFAPQVAAMIGIGVGIDYALLVVTRFRDAVHRGLEPEDATARAMATAGRSVMFAGSVVVVSLLGMLLMDFAVVRGVAISAASAVLVTMLASITLLPALLGFVGSRIDRFHVPRLSHRGRTADGRASLSYRWSRVVQRRPWPAAVLGAALLVVLAIPLFGMRLGTADEGNSPTSLTSRRAYDLLAEGFGPGFNGPLLLVADLGAAGSSEATALLGDLTEALTDTPGVDQVAPVVLNPAGDTAIVTVIPTTAPQEAATDALVDDLRARVVPSVLAGRPASVDISVGGVNASFKDFSDKIGDRLPLFVGAVIVLSFLLLMVVFRSVLVPLKAAIMNLLSIGAAFGVIVAVFQWGWLSEVFGVAKEGPIESWVPMMMFALLFGLSMDYEVFLLSRIREEYVRTGDNAGAVADGLAATARVITAAAAIMIAVFVSFALNDLRVLSLLGVGMATAVLVDATVVRMVLVPATMELLGDANWWLPRWLARVLPEVHVEAHLDAEDTMPSAGAASLSPGAAAPMSPGAAAPLSPEPAAVSPEL